jgi:hypothetical protein
MRSVKVFSSAGDHGTTGDTPVDGNTLSGSTASRWVDMQNTRDDKVVLLVKWDGNGAFKIRLQAVFDDYETDPHVMSSSGIVVNIPLHPTTPPTEITQAHMTAGGLIAEGPFSIQAGIISGTIATLHAYTPKLPRMLVKFIGVSGTPTVDVWLIA